MRPNGSIGRGTVIAKGDHDCRELADREPQHNAAEHRKTGSDLIATITPKLCGGHGNEAFHCIICVLRLTLYKLLYNAHMKPVEFLGDSLEALKQFPRIARRSAGLPLDQVQRGLDPDDWKPLKTVGAGVNEIRVRDAAGAFRVIYVARLAEAIFVLHCFEKKSRRTPASDIAIARKRYRQLVWRYR